MHGRTSILTAIAAVAAVAALTGCPGDSTAPTLASATSRYDAGQYELALSEGEAVVSRGPAADRAQAELVAGMAAFQLDRFDAAEGHFIAAERSGAPGIRGRARVMLANIRLEQGRNDDAAALFESGAADLSGTDADKARRYASLAREGQLGAGQPHVAASAAHAVVPVATVTVPSATGSSASPARGATASPAPAPAASTAPTEAPAASRSAATAAAAAAARAASPARSQHATGPAQATQSDPAPATGGVFTVRAGAYTTEAAARRRAKALAPDVRRAKSPEPHIAAVPTKDGDTLYAVRIGTFRSRADAEALLKRLARKDLAVGAL